MRYAACAASLLVACPALAQVCSGSRCFVTRAVTPGYLRLHDEQTLDVCGETSTGTVPAGVAVTATGNVLVWIQSTGPLNEYDRLSGALVRTVIQAGSGGALQGRDVEVMPSGDILIAGGSAHRIARFRGGDGAYLGDFVPGGSGGLNTPFGMCFGPNGNLFVASVGTNEVLEYTGTTGAFLRVFVAAGAGGMAFPYDAAFGPDGHLYVTSRDSGKVHRFDGDTGIPLGQFTQIDIPPARGLAFGPDGNLFVCAWGGPMGGGVYEFHGQTGAFIRLASSGSGSMFIGFDCVVQITQQPTPHTAFSTQATSFSVLASGGGSHSYQWRRNGLPLVSGGRIAGATSSTLAINPVLMEDAGAYDVVIRTPCRTIATQSATLAVACYPNCDGSTALPVMNVADFTCFLQRFAVGDPYANCDASTAAPVHNVADFTCFLQRFAVGCP